MSFLGISLILLSSLILIFPLSSFYLPSLPLSLSVSSYSLFILFLPFPLPYFSTSRSSLSSIFCLNKRQEQQGGEKQIEAERMKER